MKLNSSLVKPDQAELNCHVAKSGGLSALGLALGTLIGSGIQAWLRVDIVPLGVSRYLPPLPCIPLMISTLNSGPTLGRWMKALVSSITILYYCDAEL